VLLRGGGGKGEEDGREGKGREEKGRVCPLMQIPGSAPVTCIYTIVI